MAHYRFVTEWEFTAPLQAVWGAILNSQDWPKWWPGVLVVMPVKPGGPAGIGDVRRYAMRSFLPYTLEFDLEATEIVPLVRLAGVASGEVVGDGRWTFAATDTGCRVRYEWDVRTVPLWMNLVAPFARPLIKWNHDHIMARGARGLCAHLRTQMIAETNVSRESA